jgi:hypothetical protein
VGWRLFEASFEEFAGYGVEHAVEEVDAFGGGVAASYLQCFVDDNGRGGLGIAKHFGYGGAEEVAVYGGHAFEAPVLGVLLNEGVYFVFAGGGEAVEIVCKAFGFIIYVFAGVPEEEFDFVGFLLAEVALEEHLHG